MILALLLGCPTDDKADNSENVTVEDLGSFTSDADGIVAIPWEAPENVVSTEVFCGPYGYDTLATADDVTDPGGTMVYDDEDPYGGAMRVGVLEDLLPVLIPVSPELPASAGTWNLNMYVDTTQLPTTVSCKAINRIGDVSDLNGVNIHVVFVGVDSISAGMNATSGEGDESVQAALTGLGDLWAELGLSVASVRYSDFDGDVDTYSTVDGAEEFGNLLRTVETKNELTFFFVQDIDLGDGASILGLSGGPPGTATVGGTSKSGVVVNVANIVASPADVSLIMAHEGGHFMGLFHPTEKDVSGFDPLGDTPECADADGNGKADSSECGGSGTDNVMWWAASSGTATGFSADQAWVVARNAVVAPQ